MLRTSLFAVVLLVCTTAQAQVDVQTDAAKVRVDGGQVRVHTTNGADSGATKAGKRVAAAVAGGHTLTGSGQNLSHECREGEDITLSGTGNRVSLRGDCGTLELNGSDNAVRAEAVATIHVTGSDNLVYWSRGKQPAFHQTGSGNQLAHADE